MRRVIRRQAARQDLVDIVYYYLRKRVPDTAHRFRDHAESLFRQLASMPGLGSRYEHEHPALAEVRCQPVSPFKNYLVFYRPIPDGIEVLRVLHGARDIHGILSEEFGLGEDGGQDA